MKIRAFAPRNARTRHGQKYPWIVCATAMVNQLYFYGVDRDFGPVLF